MGWDRVKEARRRLALEQGTVIKDWGGRLAVALIYPNSYYIGMSNLGVHSIYRSLNNYGEVVAERAFWEKENSENRLSPLSLESQRPLTDFTVLAFSISYELDYFNAVQILKTSGIPLYAADRDERHPLVIAGGPCVTVNPVPLSPFFDCLCIGEAEAILPDWLRALAEGIEGDRDALLEALAKVPGVYVPQYHSGTPVVRQCANPPGKMPAASVILTPNTELGDLYLIEVERGCNWSCRFCLTSSAFHPMRFYSLSSILSQAEHGLKYRKRLGLVGAAVTDHPQIEEILGRLRRMGAEFSLSSLRIRPLSRTVLAEMAKGKARTIALAPEAGSQHLRQVIRKGISEDDILEAMGKVAEQGIRQLKLYFMIGLPTETEADIEAIITLARKCKAVLSKVQPGSRLSLNIAPFVPKAGTPFQWLPMAPLKKLNGSLAMLRESLSPEGIKIKAESPAWSEVQAVLSRGDTHVAHALAGVEEISLSGWRRAAEQCQLDIDYYAHQSWDTDKSLPWAAIELGNRPETLKLELDRALA
jgi:radical SAM superfamily enzyme YgiQ (UPF0313 family)